MHPSIPFGETEIVSVVDINSGISKVNIKVCYVQDAPNRNRSIITKDFAKNVLAKSLRGAPIVGYYNEDTKDFEEHNKYLHWNEEAQDIEFKSDTQAYGFVDINAEIWFQKFIEDNGVEREYLCTEGYMFTDMFPETQRIIDKGNNQSMELDKIDGYWTKDLGGRDKFFIVNEAIIKNLCILGEDYEPCFEGAQIKQEFSLTTNDLSNQLFSLMKQFNFNKEGEKKMDYNLNEIPEYKELQEKYSALEEELQAVQTSADEYKAGKEKAEEEKKAADEELEEMKKKCHSLEEASGQYNLDDVVEYQELTAQFSALQEECNALKEFKHEIETAQKQDMVAKFTIVPQEEKDRILNDLDSYTVDQIESEFAVYCFRNNLMFEKEKEEKPVEPMQFKLEDVVVDELGEALKHNKNK